MGRFLEAWIFYLLNNLPATYAEVGVFYIGELAPGRHFIYASSNTDSGSWNTLAYFNTGWAKCQSEYGGRVAWLDTAEVFRGVEAWLGMRWEALYANYFCRRSIDDDACGMPSGLWRQGDSDPASIKALSVWTTDHTAPKAAGSTWKLLAADYPDIGDKVEFADTIFSSHVPGRLIFNKDSGAATLGFVNTNTNPGWVNRKLQERGWNLICEVPEALRPDSSESLHFQRDGSRTLAPPFPLATVDVGEGNAAMMRCSQECHARRACMAFAVETTGSLCHLYDWVKEVGGTQPAKFYRLV